jgi:tetratricopeptide (TPR) repeat protein
MFAECALNDAGNLQFAESMIQNLRAMKPHVKRSKFGLRRGGGHAFRKALRGKEWNVVLRTGIDRLKDDPWDVTTLRAMAEACAALHYNEVELVYLKQALDAEPKSADVNRHCARSLGRMGQFDQAIACWHRVEKLIGRDEEATRMISILAQEKLTYPGGRPQAVHKEQVPTKVEEQEPEQVPRNVVLSPEQQLEHVISEDPKNAGNYLALAELLIRANRVNAAEAVLNRGIAACGQQQSIVEQLDKLRSLRADEQRRLDEESALKQQLMDAPIRIPWMELAFGFIVLILILQLVPSAGAAAWRIVDVSEWSQLGWFIFNVGVLIGLISVRFAPNLREIIIGRRIRRTQRGHASRQRPRIAQ